jgi:hypothetical protein
MLPFNKRHRDPQPSANGLPRFPLPSLSAVHAPVRPRMESFSDEERTTLMQRTPSSGHLVARRPASSPPPAPPARARANPSSRPPPAPPSARPSQRVFPPKPTMDDPTKTAYAAPSPMFTLPVSQMVIPGPPRMPSDAPPPPVVASVPPPPMSTGDLPAAVITSNTKIIAGRPTASWTAALVAVGVFAGLVTAVLARGDGDALLANLVDPGHKAAAAQLAAPPSVSMPVATTVSITPVIAAPAKVACADDAKPQAGNTAPTVIADTKGVDVTADKKVETKAETAKAETKVEPKAAPKPAPKAFVAAIAKPAAVAPKVDVAKPAAVAAKPAPAPKKAADDVESASAADALAKAQLEAALGR